MSVKWKMMTMTAVAAFVLATGSAQAHGTGWVIDETAKNLGITKEPFDLTPSDIDKLTDKQANGLAKVEREMWGCQGCVFGSIRAKNSREWLKKALVKFSSISN